jgi:hypothetical protein
MSPERISTVYIINPLTSLWSSMGIAPIIAGEVVPVRNYYIMPWRRMGGMDV